MGADLPPPAPSEIGLTLFNPALFGPFNTQGAGQICPQAFSFSPELQERVACSKMGSHLRPTFGVSVT